MYPQLIFTYLTVDSTKRFDVIMWAGAANEKLASYNKCNHKEAKKEWEV